MSETVNQGTTPTPEPSEQKTFSQDEVNAIVGERLKRESAKYADYEDLKAKAAKYDEYEAANKSELEKAQEANANLTKELEALKKSNEVREVREKIAKETGVPSNLLTADTEDECKAQAEAIKAFAKPGAYPTVKDGGEVTGGSKQSTRDQFKNWFEEQTK